MLVENKVLEMKEKPFLSLCSCVCSSSFFLFFISAWLSVFLVKLPLCLVSSLLLFPSLPLPLPPSASHPPPSLLLPPEKQKKPDPSASQASQQ